MRYIAEFLRVARPGGLVVFQAPAGVFTEEEIDARHGRPPDGYRASIEVQAPASIDAGGRTAVLVRVTNLSEATWLTDIPGGRHICVANHWLDSNGVPVVPDDGRARLPCDLPPGESVDVSLDITAPETPARYLLDVDLVQERICWFEERGSRTGRVPVDVRASGGGAHGEALHPAARSSPRRREGIIARLRRVVQGAPPVFEMRPPRVPTLNAVVSAGGTVGTQSRRRCRRRLAQLRVWRRRRLASGL